MDLIVLITINELFPTSAMSSKHFQYIWPCPDSHSGMCIHIVMVGEWSMFAESLNWWADKLHSPNICMLWGLLSTGPSHSRSTEFVSQHQSEIFICKVLKSISINGTYKLTTSHHEWCILVSTWQLTKSKAKQHRTQTVIIHTIMLTCLHWTLHYGDGNHSIL